MNRHDALNYLLLGALMITTSCTAGSLDIPQAGYAHMRDKHTVVAEPWPEQPELMRSNPTPLPDELFCSVLVACDTYEVPECVALGLIEVESGFDMDAISTKGCYGLCRLNPDYFPSGLSPEDNIAEGLEYLGNLLEQYGDTDAALTAYNAGYDTGSRQYAASVLKAADRWEETFRRESI